MAIHIRRQAAHSLDVRSKRYSQEFQLIDAIIDSCRDWANNVYKYLFSSIRDRGTTEMTNMMVPQLAMNATVLSFQPYA